jgi:sialidase-1
MLGSDEYEVVFGSGEGIQLRRGAHAGRLVMPGGFRRRWGNRMFLSDDHGETWRVGEIAPRDLVEDLNVRLENKVAELSDGTLVLNARHTPERVRAFSTDGGVTWSPEEVDPGLPAVSCNGALLCVRDETGRDVLLCSVPVGPKRTHGTIYTSYDGGRTWPVANTLVAGEFAYSSLVRLADGRIGLFYESRGHRDITLLRIPLARLLE